MTREISTDQCSLVLISVLLTCADRPVNGTRSALLNVETCDGFYRAIWTYLAPPVLHGGYMAHHQARGWMFVTWSTVQDGAIEIDSWRPPP